MIKNLEDFGSRDLFSGKDARRDLSLFDCLHGEIYKSEIEN